MIALSRLFNKAEAPKTQTAKENITASLEQSELESIAYSNTEDMASRLAAIKLLPYGEKLIQLAFGEQAHRIQRASRQRIAELIDDDASLIKRFCEKVQDPIARFAVMGLSKQHDHQQQMLDLITDQSLLCEISLSSDSTTLRQMAAQKIDDHKLLSRLLKGAKSKDKTVFHIAKRKLDVYKNEQRQHAERQAQIEKICAAAEQHTKRVLDVRYAAKTEELKQRWQQYAEHASDAAAQRFQLALSHCEKIINAQAQALAEAEEKRRAREAILSEREQLLGDAQALLAEIFACDADTASELLAKVSAMREKWNSLSTKYDAKSSIEKNFIQLCNECDTAIQQLNEFGGLKDQVDKLHETQAFEDYKNLKTRLKPVRLIGKQERPQVIIAAQEAVSVWQQEQKDKKEAERKAIRGIASLISKSRDAVKHGRFSQAFGIRNKIEKRIATIERVPPNIARQLETLLEELDKFQDWRDYAVLPKKKALAEAMEALIGIDLTEDALAERIRQLQEEWRAVSKGAKDRYPELWERFHVAAEKAYEPCHAFFKQKSDLREHNLHQRQRIANQLVDYCQEQNWEDVEWKKVEKILHTAQSEWRSHSPCNRGELKEIQKIFDEVVNNIWGRLEQEYQSNIEAKQDLIARAEQALGNEDIKQSIETIKHLQAQWKQVGITPRKKDQSLWKQFRSHCDAIFAKQQQEFEMLQSEQKAKLQQLMEIVEQVDRLVELPDKELLDARRQFKSLQSEFNEHVASIAKDKDIKRKFAQARQGFESRVKQAQAAAQEIGWSNLFAASDAIRRYELAQCEKTDAESALTDANALIDSIEQWPHNAKLVIQEKLQALQNNPSTTLDAAENELHLRELCIRAEMLTELPTPAEDQDQRREYQLRCLEQSFGKSALPAAEEMEALVFEWVKAGAVATPVYSELLERFNACRKAVR